MLAHYLPTLTDDVGQETLVDLELEPVRLGEMVRRDLRDYEDVPESAYAFQRDTDLGFH